MYISYNIQIIENGLHFFMIEGERVKVRIRPKGTKPWGTHFRTNITPHCRDNETLISRECSYNG